MRKIITQILILISTVSFGQELTSIKITVPNKTDEVYIVGNQESLGDWEPDKIKLNKTSQYERGISLNLSFPAEFKFTRGNWESEANVVDYENGGNIVLTKSTNQCEFEITNWKDEKIENGKFSLKYDIKYLTSKYYPNEERSIKVFLPKNYNISYKYPVIYTLDGQNLFHLVIQNISVLQDKSYYDNNIIPECIVVAIDNTNRMRDLTPNMGLDLDVPVGNYMKDSETFYKIINQEIVPFINKNYSVSGFNVIIGHSDAGHFVTQLFLNDDNNFKGVIALSVNDFKNYFQEKLPAKLNGNNSKLFFIGYGNKDDEFNLLGSYLENQKILNENFMVKKYNADHIQLPFTSLFDAVKFMFSDYKAYDKLIKNTYNKGFNYQTFKEYYINNIAEKYGIKTDIDYDIYYLLNKARDNNNPFVFNLLLDEVDRSNNLQLQVRFFASNEFDQNERAKNYLYEMLKSNDNTDKLIFFANLDDQYKDFFVNKLKQPEEFIDFVEKAKKKWPEYTLEFSYLVLKTVVDEKMRFTKRKKYYKYCEQNFKENRYFTQENLKLLSMK
jgi:predicted alpha/beta superfamily hydrolase